MAQKRASIKDSLSYTNELVASGKLAEAHQLIQKYCQGSNNSARSMNTYAQLSYWITQFELAENVFQKAIDSYPSDTKLKSDFGNMLYDQHRFDKAKNQYQDYYLLDSTNIDLNLKLSSILYWNGQTTKALSILEQNIKYNATHKESLQLKNQILAAQRPYLILKNEYYSDQQPIHKYLGNIELGVYKSRYLAPSIHVKTQQFLSPKSSLYELSVGNSFSFSKLKSKLDINLGAVSFSNELKSIGKANLETKITKNLSASLSYQKNPYYYTLSSLTLPMFLYQEVNIGLSWGKKYESSFVKTSFLKLENWNAKASIGRQYFDQNQIDGTYAWVLSPPIATKSISARLGYVYSYTNSAELRYSSVKSYSEILSNWSPAPIQGFYMPYFTPLNQSIHGLITNVDIQLNKSMILELRGNFALKAQAEAPYLFIQKANDTALTTGSSLVAYHPMKLSSAIKYMLNARFNIGLDYQYSKAFFFTSSQAAIEIKYTF